MFRKGIIGSIIYIRSVLHLLIESLNMLRAQSWVPGLVDAMRRLSQSSDFLTLDELLKSHNNTLIAVVADWHAVTNAQNAPQDLRLYLVLDLTLKLEASAAKNVFGVSIA